MTMKTRSRVSPSVAVVRDGTASTKSGKDRTKEQRKQQRRRNSIATSKPSTVGSSTESQKYFKQPGKSSGGRVGVRRTKETPEVSKTNTSRGRGAKKASLSKKKGAPASSSSSRPSATRPSILRRRRAFAARATAPSERPSVREQLGLFRNKGEYETAKKECRSLGRRLHKAKRRLLLDIEEEQKAKKAELKGASAALRSIVSKDVAPASLPTGGTIGVSATNQADKNTGVLETIYEKQAV